MSYRRLHGSAEELQALVRARAGCLASRQLLAEHYTGIVRYCANRMRAVGGVDVDDAEQEGHLAVQRALDKYEVGSPLKLHNYVTMWVKAYIGRYARRNKFVVRYDSGTNRISRPLDVSLNEGAYNSDDLDEVPTYLDLLRSEDSSPEDNAEMKQEVAAVERAFKCAVEKLRSTRNAKNTTLQRRDFSTLCSDLYRSRIYSEDPDTLEEVGSRNGVSRELVRNLEKKLLNEVRSILENGRRSCPRESYMD